MIRRATRSDLTTVHSLLIDFLQSTSYDKHMADLDEEHIKKLAYNVIQVGYVWLYEHEQVAVGLLIAIKEQNIWMPSKVSLRELVWFVKEEYRRSPGAGRLFIEFCRLGDQLLLNKEIEGYFTTRMATTGDYDLSKRGFREVERLFLKD